MKKLILLCCLLFVALQLSGCVLFHGYSPAIQQGNEITPSSVGQLHSGMTKGQVEALMGSPIYTTTFSDSRWDYVYTYKKGYRSMQEQVVIVSFSNGVVSNVQKNLSALPSRYKTSWF